MFHINWAKKVKTNPSILLRLDYARGLSLKFLDTIGIDFNHFL